MSLYHDMLRERGFLLPSRFETIIRVMALVASVVAVGIAGAWTVLWTFPILQVIIPIAEGVKRIYWKGFDPFIRRGAARGDILKLLFWNVLTAILDWVLCAIPPVIAAFLLTAFADGKPLGPVAMWLFFWACICPPFMYPLQDGKLEVRLYPLFMRHLPGVVLVFSLFCPVTALWVLAIYALATIPAVGISICLRLEGWIKEFDRLYSETHQEGSAPASSEQNDSKLWRPRPGVLFEPRIGQAFGNVDATSKAMMTKSLTILRISWFGCFASLAMLIVGSALACIYASSLWLLVVPPTAFVGLLLGLGISEIDRKRKPDEHELRGMFLLVMYGLVGVTVLWLGGHSTTLLIAAAMLMASSFWFFTGFIVRGSSEGTNDTLDLVALALGLAAIVACRQCLGLVWWESLLPLILSAGVPGYIRTRWPRRDLPFAVEVTPPLLDYKKEKRDRRERKRERQLSALRRSQRRG